MNSIELTSSDIGCWGDGSFGHQNTRNCCGNTLKALGNQNEELVASLYGPMPDDAWDEHEAETWLNELVSSRPPEAYFGWQDGDFGLWKTEHD